MVPTISIILRAVFFNGVSTTKSTLSVPAPGWQFEQSYDRSAEITPMASRKSSTESPLSELVVTFLKNAPAVGDFADAVCRSCAAARPVSPPTNTKIDTVVFDQVFMFYSLRLKSKRTRRRAGSARPRKSAGPDGRARAPRGI